MHIGDLVQAFGDDGEQLPDWAWRLDEGEAAYGSRRLAYVPVHIDGDYLVEADLDDDGGSVLIPAGDPLEPLSVAPGVVWARFTGSEETSTIGGTDQWSLVWLGRDRMATVVELDGADVELTGVRRCLAAGRHEAIVRWLTDLGEETGHDLVLGLQ